MTHVIIFLSDFASYDVTVRWPGLPPASAASLARGVCGLSGVPTLCAPLLRNSSAVNLSRVGTCSCPSISGEQLAPTVVYKGSSCELGNEQRLDVGEGPCLQMETSAVENTYSACAATFDFDSCLGYRASSAQALFARMGSWQPCWVYAPNPSKTTFTDPKVLLEAPLTEAKATAVLLMSIGGGLLLLGGSACALRIATRKAAGR